MRRERHRGLTLVEMLLVMVLVVVLSGAVLTLLVRGRVLWQTSVGPARAAEELGAVVGDLCAEITDSARSSVALVPVPGGGQGIVFASAWDGERFVTDPVTGRPLWQRYVVVGPVRGQGAQGGTFRWVVAPPKPDRLEAGAPPFEPGGEAAFTRLLESTPRTRMADGVVTVLEVQAPEKEEGLCGLRLEVVGESARTEVTRWVYTQN